MKQTTDMIQQKNALNKEKISHTTKTEPYSIHKVSLPGEGKGMVYLHWHAEAELFYVLEGEIDFYVENDLYHLASGNAIFIPPNLLHYAVSTSEENVIFQALVFATELVVEPADSIRFQKYIQPVLQDNRHYCLLITPDKQAVWKTQILNDIRRILEVLNSTESDNKDNETDLLIEGLIQVIWYSIYRHHFKNLYKNRSTGRMETQVQKIIQYIQDHYQEEISLTTLAQVVHITEAQLCRSFKKVTGTTIFAYLKKYRILKSCEWLQNSDKKIQEICGLCGFQNISYYNRAFLYLMKTTPSEYRKHL